MVKFVRASARITHSDPKAEFGAIAVALATHFGRNNAEVDGQQFLEQLEGLVGPAGAELVSLLQTVVDSVTSGEPTLRFTASIGLERGVSGYTYHTVPVAIHAWLTNPRDYREAVSTVIQCGGDADTTAAIVGGIIGATTGETSIPSEWLSNICEWPRSIQWMRILGSQLSNSQMEQNPRPPVSNHFLAVLTRNAFFLFVVLFHGFRRLFPPY